LLLVLTVPLCIWACKDNWEEHNEMDPTLNMNVLDQVKADPDLSVFAGLVAKAGLEPLLKSANSFTVWAPVNSALANLDESTVNNDSLLKQFVTNHIAYQEYFTYSPKPSMRVKMINGKYHTWFADNLEGVTLVSADRYSRNGVLHTINSALTPLPNNWEYLRRLTSAYGTFVKSLDYQVFVDSLAVKTGVNPVTGNPIYQEGTGYVTLNALLNTFPTLDDEHAWSTVLVLTDDAFNAEVTKLKPFFKTPAEVTTVRNSSSFLVKDLCFEQLYTPENLPDVLISKFKTNVPVDKSAIVETHKTSNGMIYVMGKVNFNLKDIIKPIVIEGEGLTVSALSSADKAFNVQIRNREYASQGLDLRISGHNLAGFYVRYTANVYSVAKYRVYWVANNDFQAAFTQRLAMDTTTNATFPAINVGTNNATRVLLGEYTMPLVQYRMLRLFLIAPVNSTPLALDRIELEPVF
jgi:uncharacterized surface protein with fasciclin (FAS1) repeats